MNQIGVAGCGALSEALPSLNNLQTLNLECNCIHFQKIFLLENFFDISTTEKININLKIVIFVLSNVKTLSSFLKIFLL